MIFPGQHMPTRTPAERKARDAAFAVWVAEERERIRRQRIYLTGLSDPLGDAMVQRMLDRAWDLLDAGEAEAADALLEFVPEDRAEKLLREFFPEVYDEPATKTRMRRLGDPSEPYVAPPSIRRWQARTAARRSNSR